MSVMDSMLINVVNFVSLNLFRKKSTGDKAKQLFQKVTHTRQDEDENVSKSNVKLGCLSWCCHKKACVDL